MHTPNSIKNWLRNPGATVRDTDYKADTLEYLLRLERIVALYTQRDGKIKSERKTKRTETARSDFPAARPL